MTSLTPTTLAWNGDENVRTDIIRISEKYNCKIAVETGTFRGWTSKDLSKIFKKVYTIEVNFLNYCKSHAALYYTRNVTVINGDSAKQLELLLPKINSEFIFFYLDAHWESYWPLLDELKSIAKYCHNSCVICIDDVKVPNRPDIPFDTYNGNDLSFEYIRSEIEKIYDSYTYEYLIPNQMAEKYHAKIIFYPSDLQSKNKKLIE